MKTTKTNNVSFTPGPWYASKDERCIYAKLQTTDGSYVEPLIAQCSKLTTSANANAVLIAAAPEMLSALEDCLNELDKYKNYFPKNAKIDHLMDIIGLTINKARGE